MQRLPLALAAIICAITLTARAEDSTWQGPPDHLTIGYEEEGKIDDSQESCAKMVREMVEWPEAETLKGIRSVCAARKRHVEAYAELQQSYTALVKHIGNDHRLNPVEAVKDFEAMIKACIDHKQNITTGGHNIAMDMIPNDNAAACLKMGKQLLDSETAWFKHGYTDADPSP